MLTEKQRALYDYLRQYIEEHEYAPTIIELRDHFGLASNFAIQKRLKTLHQKGYVEFDRSNTARNIRLTGLSGVSAMLSVVGTVTAGVPIEAIEIPEPIEVPRRLLRGSNNFALRVRGDSMLDANIEDGDIIIVKSQPRADHGQIVVATINGAATVKKLDTSGPRIYLQPCNTVRNYPPIPVDPDDDFEIKGIVVGLLRQYGLRSGAPSLSSPGRRPLVAGAWMA